jgi:hypothetical protein
MAGDAVVKLRPLRIRQRCGVRLQAFPERIEQFCLLRGGEAVDLASQIAHMPTTLARFFGSCKLYFQEPAVLFFPRVEHAEQRFLDAAGAGGLELLSDSGLQGCVADFDGRGCSLGLRVRERVRGNQQNR